MAFTIKQKCDFLGELEKAEPARAKDIGELIGLDAFNAGQLTKDLRLSGLIEWTNKAKHLYQTTEKGRKFKAKPPAEIKPEEEKKTPPATESVTKTVTETGPSQTSPEKKPEAENKEEPAIPSQADIFQSIAEQLSISKQKDGAPLSAHNLLCPADSRRGRLELLVGLGQAY